MDYMTIYMFWRDYSVDGPAIKAEPTLSPSFLPYNSIVYYSFFLTLLVYKTKLSYNFSAILMDIYD